MTTSIGWASVQITPVIGGVAGDISRQLQQPMRQAGQSAGQDLGQGIADGLKQAEAAVKTATRKIEQARSAEQSAAAKLNIEERKLQELRESGKAKASQLMAAEERVRQAREKHNTTVGATEAALKGLERAQERVAQATAEAGDAAQESERRLIGFSNAVDDAGDGADSGIGKLAGFTAAIAGIGGAVELGMQALDNLNIENKLAAQLGATGELAAEYGDIAGGLYKNALAGSMEEAADAVSVVATSFAWAGSEGEKSIDQIAESALNFGKVFDTEVTESVNTASILVTNGLAKDSTEAFDLMTTAFQRVPAAMRDELPEILHEYATNFRGLGFDGEEAFNLLVTAADRGKFVLDKTGDALKEFTLLGSDMSESSQEAYKAIGLSAEEMSRKIATGGDGAQEALQATASGLLEIKDPLERANTAIALFGTPLEDLSVDQIPMFLEGLTGAENRMAGFAGSAEQMGETINSGPGHALEQFKNAITGGLTEALGDMAMWVMENSDTLETLAMVAAPFFGALAGYAATVKIIQIGTIAWNAAQMLLNGTMMLNPVGLIVAAIAGLVAAVVLIATKTTWFQTIWDFVWNAIKAAWDWVWGALQSGFEALKGAFGAVGDKVGEVKDWIVQKWNDVVGFVTGLPGKIASAASGMWDGIKNAFKGAINWIIQAWNALEFRIPGFEVGPVKWDGFTLGLPDIPMLAQGGPITGGTPGKDSVLAMLMPGEHVLDTGDVAALGGQEGVYRLRAALDMGNVPRFADGGAVVSPDQLDHFARGVEGKPYVWGGVNWGDCSGAVSALANYATGRDPFGSRFATMTEGAELAARGFKPGLGPAGSLQVGWFNGGPYGGHTSATLPNGVNFEMGGGRGNGQYGGQAAPASHSQYTDHAHLPMVVAQLVQPNVQQLDPLTGFPIGDANPAAAQFSTDPTGGTTAPAPMSARERFKQFGAEAGGIAADAFVDIFGLGDVFSAVDRWTVDVPPAAAAVSTAPTTGENGVDGDPNLIPWLADINNFLKGTGLFDTGGYLMPGQLAFNGLTKPEPVLKPEHWEVARANIDRVDEIVNSGSSGGFGGSRMQITNQITVSDDRSQIRKLRESNKMLLMQYGGAR